MAIFIHFVITPPNRKIRKKRKSHGQRIIGTTLTDKDRDMGKLRWLALLVVWGFSWASVWAEGWRKDSADLHYISQNLKGRIIDYTANHGKDNRIWSRILWQRRDLYVYLPPGYQSCHRYPLMIWMHGFADDEQSFLRHIVPAIDQAICTGKMPPLIVVAPDGSISGEPKVHQNASFFLNSSTGSYEDFVLQDVWDFVVSRFPIRHEREAHILAGHSTGGLAAYHHGIKHSYAFGVVIGVNPPLNLRWTDKNGFYPANFNPYDWGWRQQAGNGREVLGRLKGMKTIRIEDWFGPLFAVGGTPLYDVSSINPVEMLNRYKICPGRLEMYAAYGGQDELNIDAQVESFLYVAKWMGLPVGVGYDRYGRHNIRTVKRFIPGLCEWLAPRLTPYSPIMCGTCGESCWECQCTPEASFPPKRAKIKGRFGSRHSPPPVGPHGSYNVNAWPPYPVTLPDPIPPAR